MCEMQSAANLDAFRLHRRREVMKSARDLCVRAGLPVKVGEVGFRPVINMLTCMFWGGTLGEEEAVRIGEEFREAVARLTSLLGKPNVSDFFPVIARFDVQGVEREMKEVVAWIGRIFDFVIRQRMSLEELGGGKGCERGDFLQFLLEYKEEETGRSITPEQIKALLMVIFYPFSQFKISRRTSSHANFFYHVGFTRTSLLEVPIPRRPWSNGQCPSCYYTHRSFSTSRRAPRHCRAEQRGRGVPYPQVTILAFGSE